MTPLRWHHIGTVYADTETTKVYRSTCGRLGQVLRTSRCRGRQWRAPQWRYFIWDDGEDEDAPEYGTVEEALAAMRHEEVA